MCEWAEGNFEMKSSAIILLVQMLKIAPQLVVDGRAWFSFLPPHSSKFQVTIIIMFDVRVFGKQQNRKTNLFANRKQ